MKYSIIAVRGVLEERLEELLELEVSDEYDPDVSVLSAVAHELDALGYERKYTGLCGYPFDTKIPNEYSVFNEINTLRVVEHIRMVKRFLRELDLVSPTETSIDEKEIPTEVKLLLIDGVNKSRYYPKKRFNLLVKAIVEKAIRTGWLMYRDSLYRIEAKAPDAKEKTKAPPPPVIDIAPTESRMVMDGFSIKDSDAAYGVIFFVIAVILASVIASLT